MAFEAFGKLEPGTFFKHEGQLWVKTDLLPYRDSYFNAFTVNVADGSAPERRFDEATLVDTKEVDPEVQKRVTALFYKQ